MDSIVGVGSKEHAVRSKDMHKQNMRAKAPLAAQFEDCAQVVKQAYAALHADASVEQQKSLRVYIGRCLGRLITWGHETGASSRLLDHSLRRASKPRDNTLTLLKELHERVQNVVHVLPALFGGADGFGERPVEEPLEQDSEQLAPSLPSSAARPSEHANTNEIIDILGLGDPDSELNPERYLEEAEAIIDDLYDLRSILLDPYEDDDDGAQSLPEAAQLELADREYAQKVFVQATPFLVHRLLAANRRRRQNIYRLRQAAAVNNDSSTEQGKTAPSSQLAPDCTARNIRPPRHRPAPLRGYKRSKATSDSEAGASKTAPSTADARGSLFSQAANDDVKSMTSFTSGSNSLSAVPELYPPGPPVDLSVGKNIPFQCQYCSFEVPLELDRVGMTPGDWVAHFYLDLQPYVCTFEGCSRAHKLFGQKQEWFQHELDYHRTRQVWYCADAGCETEFETRALFEQHLQSKHPNAIAQTPADFLGIFIDTCQRLSVAPQPAPQQHCILCGAFYGETQVEWKDHLANHLEQFALLAIGEDNESPSAEDEVDPQAATEQYALEMSAMYASRKSQFPVTKRPVTTIQGSLRPEDSTGQPHLTDSSNAPGDSGGEVRHRERAEPLWEDKVDNYLKEGSGEDEADVTKTVDTIFLHVPGRNEEFVGRDNDLHHLNEYISQPGHICVISGRGGIGKTATAVEYARRLEGSYSAVMWIEAETPGGLSDKYNSIGTKIFSLGAETRKDSVSFTLTIRGMLERWEQAWLLIFDNVESWDDIARYIPRNLPKTKGSVLITTRQQDLIKMDIRALQRVLRRIELDPLTSEEGAEFLIRSIHSQVAHKDVPAHPDYTDAIRAADLVERLPLALIMVAGYVKVSRSTFQESPFQDFLEIWEEKSEFRTKNAKRNRLIVEGGLDSSIDLLWDIGISELSVPARNLLEILAFLDPEKIQKELLVGDHTEEFLEFLNSTETTQYRRMIRQLSGRKLIEIRGPEEGRAGESYRIHRLLQQKIILDMGAQLKLDGALTKATRLVRKRFPRAPPTQAPAVQNKKLCNEYIPHVRSLLRAFTEANEMYPDVEKIEELADLFYDAAFYIWDSQATEHRGHAFLDAAETILDSDDIEMDAMHPRRADIHCISGLLRNALGCQERNESMRRLKVALDIRKHVYDHTSPYRRDVDVLLQNAATDYAIMLLNRYEFEEAETILKSCLQHYHTWDPENVIPFEYSKYYYNMGVVRLVEGHLDDAIYHLQRSVDLVNDFNGKEGQYWDNYFMLACAIRQTGDFKKALEMHREILETRLEQLGKHGMATILSTYAVGETYAHLGELQSATENMERCIDLGTVAGWTEEALGRARLHLSIFYRRQGIQLDEAEALEARAMETLTNYSGYVSNWVAELKHPVIMFDDLQPTDEGRYTGGMLLKVLWARGKGDKTVTFFSYLEAEEITMNTGM